LVDELGIDVGVNPVRDGLRRRHDGDSVDEGAVRLGEIAMVDRVGRGNIAVDPIAAGDRDVDLCRVDVAEVMQLECCVVGKHPSRASWPEHGLHQVLTAGVGDDLEPIEATRDAFEGPAALHVHEALLIDTERAGIVGGHEAVLVEGAVQKNVADSGRHAQSMADSHSLCKRAHVVWSKGRWRRGEAVDASLKAPAPIQDFE